MTPDIIRNSDSSSMEPTKDTAEDVYKRGEGLYRQGKYDEAIAVLKQSDLNNFSVQYVLGSCYLEKGQYAEALQYFARIIEANSDRPEITVVWNQCALCFILQKNWQEAIQYLQNAHEINENDPQTLTNYGICLYEMRQYGEARILLNKALDLEPKNHLAQEHLRKIAVLLTNRQIDVRFQPL